VRSISSCEVGMIIGIDSSKLYQRGSRKLFVKKFNAEAADAASPAVVNIGFLSFHVSLLPFCPSLSPSHFYDHVNNLLFLSEQT
jgi:hypothetical protein